MILEGILTTVGPDGAVNVAPMGPHVDDTFARLRLRPFQTSTTFANLVRSRCGVFHVTDDVELLARAAIGRLDPPPAMRQAEAIDGWILEGACRWYAFRCSAIDDAHPRAEIEAEVVASGRERDFFGFNRAKHAVVEAAILATRVGILPPREIHDQMARLRVPVEKTGGPAEHRAMQLLADYLQAALVARQQQQQ